MRRLFAWVFCMKLLGVRLPLHSRRSLPFRSVMSTQRLLGSHNTACFAHFKISDSRVRCMVIESVLSGMRGREREDRST